VLGDDQIPQGTYSVTDQKIPFEVTRARRAGARLAAVQALYEMEQTGKSARATIRAFMEDRLGIGPNEEPIEEADPDIFKSIVNAVVEHQAAIDKAILARLASGWKLTRLDATMRALLRAGAAEFIQHQHLSNAIILDEYVSLAHDFFEEQEAKFANAVLDNLAKDLRA
jgi:N utilization substance protein B